MDKENKRRTCKRILSGETNQCTNEKAIESELEPPRRRSARLIAISKPTTVETKATMNRDVNDEQFGSLKIFTDSNTEPNVVFDEIHQNSTNESKPIRKKRYSTTETKPKGNTSKKKNDIIQLPQTNLVDDVKLKDTLNDSRFTSTFDDILSPNALLSLTPTTSSNLFVQQKLPTKIIEKEEILTSESTDNAEDDWEAMESIDNLTTITKEKKKIVEVKLEGKAAEKFKIEMNSFEMQNAKEAEERAKWEHCMHLEIKRRQKQLQEDMHRIHVLCYIGHLHFMLTKLTENRELISAKFKLLFDQTTVLSPITPNQMQEVLEDVFRANFNQNNNTLAYKPPLKWCTNGSPFINHVIEMIDHKCFHTDRECSLLFFAFCNFILELPVRLCVAFNPMPKLLDLPKYLLDEQNTKKTGAKKTGKKIANKAGKFKKAVDQTGNQRLPKNHRKMHDSSDSSWTESDDGIEIEMHHKKVKKICKKTTAKIAISTADNKHGDKIKNKQEEATPKNEEVEPRVYWNEYWDEQQRRWICVDPYFATIDLPDLIEQKIAQKFLYVLAMDNEYGVREIVAKYSSSFLTIEMRTLRTEEQWLKSSLDYQFLRANEVRARLEDANILEHLKSKPLPLKLSEYKNHPLYALTKDLLKFEAIYPADTAPIGRIGKHDIFPRSAVHKLEGSLNWIKQSRSIKEGEKPYKVVKARPKKNVPRDELEPPTLDVFGYWQTEPYRVPVVVNDRIPRNEYGNIYLYKAEMLPKGCVHLRLPGIYQLARRFNLEAVPAVVGWEFSGGFNHPILDGSVVLKKDEEILRSAWSEISRKKAADETKKHDERIWKNWRRLIRGKILLEQMRERFK